MGPLAGFEPSPSAQRLSLKNHRTSNLLSRVKKKTGSFSLIERVILSAGAMLIFSVSFQIDQMPEGSRYILILNYIGALILCWRCSLGGGCRRAGKRD